MPSYVSTYNKGLDRDSSRHKYPQGSYFFLKNMRHITFEELENGAISSVRGNIIHIEIPSKFYDYYIIIGKLIVRNYLVVWATDCNDDTGGNGSIFYVDLSLDIPYYTTVYESANMMLTAKHPIYDEAIGFYEDEDIINVYWTDNFNMFRHINIMGSGPSDVSGLDILPNVTHMESDDFKIVNIISGNINVGKVQYAVQYYNNNGVETCYSPCTPLIHLTQSSERLTGNAIRKYEGTESLDDNGDPYNSGKGIALSLSNIDTSYDKIRIAVVHYSSLNATPTVHIVGVYDTADELSIMDYGYYPHGSITLNAFLTLGNHHLYCKTVSQRNNKALIGNIREKFFDIDFDARAYRFKRTAPSPYTYDAKVWNTKTSAFDVIVKTGTWPNATYEIGGDDVPEEHDCICPYNYDFAAGEIPEVASYDDTDAAAYKFQSEGGATAPRGGDGPNVKFEFVKTTMIADVSTNTNSRYTQPDFVAIEDLSSYNSHANPLLSSTVPSNKRDEVYRYAIVFTSTRGEDSPPHWIADIRFPTMDEERLAIGTGRQSALYSLGIKFTVNTAGLSALGVAGYRIVRVKREEYDRTIVTQGIASAMFANITLSHQYSFTGYPRPVLLTPSVGVDVVYYSKFLNIIQFISPEISYFKNFQSKAGDYIKKAAALTKRYTYLTNDPNTPANTIDVAGSAELTTALGGSTFAALYNTCKWINISKYIDTVGISTLDTYGITEGVLAGPYEHGGDDENKIVFKSLSYPLYNRSIDVDPVTNQEDHEGLSGTCYIALLDDSIDISDLPGIDEMELFLFDYKRPSVAISQYGGITYEARKNNRYIDCGKYIAVTDSEQSEDIYGGDTYITFFEHLRTMYEFDDNDDDDEADVDQHNRFFNVTMFPCESIINMDLDHGARFSKYYLNKWCHAIREEAGEWRGALTNIPYSFADGSIFLQERDMYLYNTVYSQENTTKIFIPRPDLFKEEVAQDTLVKLSLEKVAGETIDSYLKFLTDNEKVLPTDFGEINDLFLFKNYMIVFMEKAVGTLSIDERAVIPIQNNSLLELGTSTNLRFFDLMSNKGCIHPMSIEMLLNGFCWFDAINGEFCLYNGETQDLGLVKGLSSEFKRYTTIIKGEDSAYYNNPFAGGSVMIYENKKFKEAVCAFTVSEFAAFKSKTDDQLVFDLEYSPGNYAHANVMINNIEYFATITGPGTGTLTIDRIENPWLDTTYYTTGYYFIYYKDISKTIVYSNAIGAFDYYVDIFPYLMFSFGEDLYDTSWSMYIYKENVGDYGEFYGIYRKAELIALINPLQSIVCVFNNYEYASEVYDDSNTNIVNETWHTLNMSNDYQWSVGDPIACTMQNVLDTITDNLHGLSNGDKIMFSGSSIPAELDIDTVYYVINVTVNTFNVALTSGGAAVVLNSNGSGYYHRLDAVISPDTDKVTRRMRTWRIKDLRDRGDLGNAMQLKPRMRDAYIKLHFKYMHDDDSRIVMHDIYSYFVPTKESRYKE